MHFFRPRKVFLYYLGAVVISLAVASGVHGNAGIGEFSQAELGFVDLFDTAMLYLTLFFESVCFPTIVALGIRGLGRHYKRGSGVIVGGVIGGGCVPALTGKVADIHNSTGIAMVVPLAVSIILDYSVYMC